MSGLQGHGGETVAGKGLNAMNEGPQFDAPLPPQMAQKAEDIGVKKGEMATLPLVMLAVLAGAFIALGAIFSTTAITGTAGKLPWGVVRLLAGVPFCLGLILVVVAGAELFTGNNLLIMAAVSGRLKPAALLRHWVLVYLGNFAGAMGTAAMMFLTRQYLMAEGGVGLAILNIAEPKCRLTMMEAVTRGIYCNALVCLAVWLTYSCRSTTDKILAIVFPISAFVAAGFEHSIANMYYIPVALFVKAGAGPEFWTAIRSSPEAFPHLTWANFVFVNLMPVTIGNMIGGVLFVAAVYWVVYRRPAPTSN